MKPIYVIGHKNPDVDSVAAAVGYKIFKQSIDPGLFLAACAGELDEQALFVLEAAGFEKPALITSVATTVDDLLDDQELIHVHPDMTLVEINNLMRSQKIKTVPVLDDKQRFLGLLTIGDVAMIFMENLGDGRQIEKSPEILNRILNLRVGEIMKSRELVFFEPDDAVDEARKQMLSTRFRNYPVVGDQNRFLGLISRYNLLQMKRKRLILVDHNEKHQAVDGIEEAEILEIIDHHRVGDLQTISPIYFHNEPVGSTSTLVAERFLRQGVFLSQPLAGLLLSGMLADTLIFKSPTTCAKDRDIAARLQEISGLEPLGWGKKIFEQALQIDRKDDRELVSADLKEYTSGDILFAIAQLQTTDLAGLERRREGLLRAMSEECRRQNYAFMCLMLTDILEEGSQLLIAGERKDLIEQAFEPGSVFQAGIMSRKKQVVPVVYDVLRKKNILG